MSSKAEYLKQHYLGGGGGGGGGEPDKKRRKKKVAGGGGGGGGVRVFDDDVDAWSARSRREAEVEEAPTVAREALEVAVPDAARRGRRADGSGWVTVSGPAEAEEAGQARLWAALWARLGG